jgi:hypothetical protein
MSEIAEKQEEEKKNVKFDDEFDLTLDDDDDFEDGPNFEVLEVKKFFF